MEVKLAENWFKNKVEWQKRRSAKLIGLRLTVMEFQVITKGRQIRKQTNESRPHWSDLVNRLE